MTHDELVELIPLAAIDALPPAEAREVIEHCETCPPCGAVLAEYARVAEALAAGVPAIAVPAQLESQLHARLGASASRRTAIWQSLFARPRWAFAGIALALLALVALALWIFYASQSDPLASEIARLQQLPGALKVAIKGTERAPDSTGQVVADPQSKTAYLIVDKLSALPSNQVYQVWLIRGTERDSAALFTVDAQGRATVRLQAPLPLNSYREIGVTVEPAGGSPRPTTGRIIGGPLTQ